MSLINFNLLSNYHTMLKTYLKKTTYVHPETHPASMIVQDQFNKFVTSTQIDRWNNKLDADANAVSASKLLKPVNINGVPFDGTKDIDFEFKYNDISLNYVLESNNNKIQIPKEVSLTEESIIYIFVNGIKFTKNLYDIDYISKIITLKNNNEKKADIEIIITNIPNINYISGILEKGKTTFSFSTNLPISNNSTIFVFINGIKIINKKHYNIDFDSKQLIFIEEYSDNAELEIIIMKV